METAEYRCYDDRDGEDLLWNFLVCGGNVAFVKVLTAMRWDLLGALRYVKGQDGANGCWSVCLRPWGVNSVSLIYVFLSLAIYLRKVIDGIENGLGRHFRSGNRGVKRCCLGITREMAENQEESDVLEWPSGVEQVGHRNAAVGNFSCIAINIGDLGSHACCVLEAGIEDADSCIVLLDSILRITRSLDLLEVCGLDRVLFNGNAVGGARPVVNHSQRVLCPCLSRNRIRSETEMIRE